MKMYLNEIDLKSHKSSHLKKALMNLAKRGLIKKTHNVQMH